MMPPPGYVESIDPNRVYALSTVARECGIPQVILIARLRQRERQKTQTVKRVDVASGSSPCGPKAPPPRVYMGSDITEILTPRRPGGWSVRDRWPDMESGLVPRRKR
jgi:hypothetical protein